jgi:peroxiredoxin
MIKLRPLPAVCALLVVTPGVAGAQDAAAAETGAPAEESVGPAPEFTLPDLEGRQVRLSDLRKDGPVLIAFFATWCRPCIQEVPHLWRIQEKYRDRGLRVVGISLDDATTAGELRTFVRRVGLHYTVLHDAEGRVAALYNPEHSLPLSVLVGQEGRIRRVHRGYVPGDEVEVEAEVVALLDEARREETDDAAWVISSQTLVESDRSDERLAGFQRTRIDVTAANVVAGARYDVEGVGIGSDHLACLRGRLGHSFLEWGSRGFGVRAGDTHAVLGRGMLLSFNQVGAFGVETTVLGGQVEGAAGPVSARVIGGTTHFSEVPQTLEGRCGEIFNPVYGGRIEARHAGATLGFHAIETREESDAGPDDGFAALDPTSDGFRGGGASLELARLPGDVHVYVEGVGVRSIDGADRTGTGLYGQVTVPIGSATFSLEGKRYRDLDLTYTAQNRKVDGKGKPFEMVLPYNVPPTLEPAELAFKSVPDTTDATGVLARLDLKLGEELDAKLGYYRVEQRGTTTIDHPRAGVEWSPADRRFGLAGGWRSEAQDDDRFAGAWQHAEAEAILPFGGSHSFDLQVRWKSFSNEAGDPRKHDLMGVLAYAIAPAFEVAVVVEHRKATPSPDAEQREYYPSATILWRLFTDGALTLFGGSDPGGLRCTSGVCRVLPAFEGVRMEGSFRY